MRNLPSGVQANNRKSEGRACYLYHIINEDNAESFYFTNNQTDVVVTGGLAALGADPRTFENKQISHEGLELTSEFSQKSVSLRMIATNSALARWLLTAPTGQINLSIWRFVGDGEIPYSTQCLPVFYGELMDMSFAGSIFSGTFTPKFYQMSKPVPRFFFQRMCNHVLYGTGCGLNKATYKRTGTITSYSRSQRTITATLTESGDRYAGGYMVEPDTGMKIGIASSSGTSGSITIKLLAWIPELEEAGKVITAYVGCKHTVDDCDSYFWNKANFGGFPCIPLKNPSTDGVS